MAMCLAVFNFDKALDANGHEIEPTVEYTSGTIRYVPSTLDVERYR